MRRVLLTAALGVLTLVICPVMAQEPELEHLETAEHATDAEHAEEGGNVTAWKALNFGLLAFALVWFLRKPAKQYFAGRTSEIQQGIQEATKAREEAEARAAEMERRLADLESEIEALRASAKGEMEAEDDRLRSETDQALAKLRLRSDQEISAAARAASQQLRAEAARLALELARGKVREQMTPEVSARLLDSFVDQLGSRPGRSA